MVMCVDLDVVGRILYYRCNLSRHSLLTFSNVNLILSHCWVAAAEDPRVRD